MASITQRAPPSRRWRSTTVRLVVLVIIFVLVAISALLGFIAASVSSAMMRQVDSLLTWQVFYYDAIQTAALPSAIHERLEYERMRVNFYGLFDQEGRHLAGDVTSLPNQSLPNRKGVTLDAGLAIEGMEQIPVMRVIAMKRGNGETLLIARDLSSVLQTRRDIFRTLFAGGAVVLIAGLIGGFLFTLHQARRLKAIRVATQRIAQGELGQRLPISGNDEIEMLVYLVNHMLDEVERLMHEVKGACDGIAHDLRTPLVHVRSLLMQIEAESGRLQNEQIGSLVSKTQDEVELLLERFRALLRISEIGALNRHGGFDEVELEQLISQLSALFDPTAESRNIKLEVTVERAAVVRGDRALLFEALSNLMDNAIKFTPDGGEVRLLLHATARGPLIEVCDTGLGIDPSEKQAVLQRFYRGEKTEHIPGSGLGLSIVWAVTQLHDFGISFGYAVEASPDGRRAPFGTRVTLECWPQSLV